MKLEKDLKRSLITDIPVIHVSTNMLRASQVALVVKNPSANAGDIRDVGSPLGWEDSLGKGMAPHSSIPAWEISWTEEPSDYNSRGCKEPNMAE